MYFVNYQALYTDIKEYYVDWIYAYTVIAILVHSQTAKVKTYSLLKIIGGASVKTFVWQFGCWIKQLFDSFILTVCPPNPLNIIATIKVSNIGQTYYICFYF